MERKKIIIDCDTGIDDAIALTAAWGWRDRLEILGVTTVSGNTSLENATRNTLNVLDWIGAGSVAVAKGADRPLAREGMKASGVHGADGLRGFTFEKNVNAALTEAAAWDFMYQKISESDKKVTIAAIGPCTNVATLFMKYPEIKNRIEAVVFMGTSYHDGNPTPVATFNVLVDPEAFRYLLKSGVPIYACPLETTRTAYITDDETEQIRAVGNRASKMLYGIMNSYGLQFIGTDEVIAEEGEEAVTPARIARAAGETKALHDPATLAFAAYPELFTGKKYYCDVECHGELTTGFTLIDKLDYYQKGEEERNLYLMESIDREKFVTHLLEAVKNCE